MVILLIKKSKARARLSCLFLLASLSLTPIPLYGQEEPKAYNSTLLHGRVVAWNSTGTAALAALPLHNKGVGDVIYISIEPESGKWSWSYLPIPLYSHEGALCGSSLALLEGNTSNNSLAVVGCAFMSASAEEAEDLTGAAIVFEQSQSGTWIKAALLRPNDVSPLDLCGWSSSVVRSGEGRGRVILISCIGDDYESNSLAGASYIFEEVEPGVWVETAKLRPRDASSYINCGWTAMLARGGGVAIISCTTKSPDSRFVGASFVFERVGSDWLETGLTTVPRLTIAEHEGN